MTEEDFKGLQPAKTVTIDRQAPRPTEQISRLIAQKLKSAGLSISPVKLEKLINKDSDVESTLSSLLEETLNPNTEVSKRAWAKLKSLKNKFAEYEALDIFKIAPTDTNSVVAEIKRDLTDKEVSEYEVDQTSTEICLGLDNIGIIVSAEKLAELIKKESQVAIKLKSLLISKNNPDQDIAKLAFDKLISLQEKLHAFNANPAKATVDETVAEILK